MDLIITKESYSIFNHKTEKNGPILRVTVSPGQQKTSNHWHNFGRHCTYKVIKEEVINEKNIKIYHQRPEWMKTGEEEELDDNEIERLNKEKKIEEKKEKLLIDQKEDGNKEEPKKQLPINLGKRNLVM